MSTYNRPNLNKKESKTMEEHNKMLREALEEKRKEKLDPFHGTEPWEDPQDFDEFGNVK